MGCKTSKETKQKERQSQQQQPITREAAPVTNIVVRTTTSPIPAPAQTAQKENALPSVIRMDIHDGITRPITTLLGHTVPTSTALHHVTFHKKKYSTKDLPIEENYDLVVAGAGISGLATAYFYRQRYGSDKKVLIVDPLEDFGGHAKRNEFFVDGKQLIGYGGSESFRTPHPNNSNVMMGLLRDLGADMFRKDKQPNTVIDKFKLARGSFFGARNFPKSALVVGDPTPWICRSDIDSKNAKTLEEFIGEFPMPEETKKNLIRLYICKDVVTLSQFKTRDERADYLSKKSYIEFLSQDWNIPREGLLYFQHRTLDFFGLPASQVSALDASCYGFPGLQGIDLPPLPVADQLNDANSLHFPDGNATIARLLVRSLIPSSVVANAKGHSMDDILFSQFDSTKLDQPGNPVRIRLGFSVVTAANTPDGTVDIGIVNNSGEGIVRRISAKHLTLACFNEAIPYIVKELAPDQGSALHSNVRAPMAQINVAVRNWNPWVKLGVHEIYGVDTFHMRTKLDFPFSGGYTPSQDPSQPIIIHMVYVPNIEDAVDIRSELRKARHQLQEKRFDEFEAAIHSDLTRMLGPGGFNADRDIAAIAVNRWSHGYAYSHNTLIDGPASESERIMNAARRRIGNITIAGSDSEWSPYLHSSVEQAYRAVEEITGFYAPKFSERGFIPVKEFAPDIAQTNSVQEAKSVINGESIVPPVSDSEAWKGDNSLSPGFGAMGSPEAIRTRVLDTEVNGMDTRAAREQGFSEKRVQEQEPTTQSNLSDLTITKSTIVPENLPPETTPSQEPPVLTEKLLTVKQGVNFYQGEQQERVSKVIIKDKVDVSEFSANITDKSLLEDPLIQQAKGSSDEHKKQRVTFYQVEQSDVPKVSIKDKVEENEFVGNTTNHSLLEEPLKQPSKSKDERIAFSQQGQIGGMPKVVIKDKVDAREFSGNVSNKTLLEEDSLKHSTKEKNEQPETLQAENKILDTFSGPSMGKDEFPTLQTENVITASMDTLHSVDEGRKESQEPFTFTQDIESSNKPRSEETITSSNKPSSRNLQQESFLPDIASTKATVESRNYLNAAKGKGNDRNVGDRPSLVQGTPPVPSVATEIVTPKSEPKEIREKRRMFINPTEILSPIAGVLPGIAQESVVMEQQASQPPAQTAVLPEKPASQSPTAVLPENKKPNELSSLIPLDHSSSEPQEGPIGKVPLRKFDKVSPSAEQKLREHIRLEQKDTPSKPVVVRLSKHECCASKSPQKGSKFTSSQIDKTAKLQVRSPNRPVVKLPQTLSQKEESKKEEQHQEDVENFRVPLEVEKSQATKDRVQRARAARQAQGLTVSSALEQRRMM